uniref:Uncharacterized protein At5g05190-like n=1 Tax=Rhizophora mucronata TaxID=61149 RepID=A0A2P2Q7R3_RHIMU
MRMHSNCKCLEHLPTNHPMITFQSSPQISIENLSHLIHTTTCIIKLHAHVSTVTTRIGMLLLKCQPMLLVAQNFPRTHQIPISTTMLILGHLGRMPTILKRTLLHCNHKLDNCIPDGQVMLIQMVVVFFRTISGLLW